MVDAVSHIHRQGSAKDGTHHWWVQRVTSVALIPLSLWMVFSILGLLDADYMFFIGWIKAPWNATALALFVAVSYYHAWLGLQVVVEDYVHTPLTKVLTLLIIKFTLALLGALALFSILKLSLT
ncbi:MAG: succinate dehydrogenase, hydrophobic membrane anchor protein [Dongiaceae bacterium]